MRARAPAPGPRGCRSRRCGHAATRAPATSSRPGRETHLEINTRGSRSHQSKTRVRQPAPQEAEPPQASPAPSDAKAVEEPRGLGSGSGSRRRSYTSPRPSAVARHSAGKLNHFPTANLTPLSPRGVPVLPSLPPCETQRTPVPTFPSWRPSCPLSPPRRPSEPSAYSPVPGGPPAWLSRAPSNGSPGHPTFHPLLLFPRSL